MVRLDIRPIFTLPRVFEWKGRRFAGEGRVDDRFGAGPPLAEARPSREAREGEAKSYPCGTFCNGLFNI